MTAGFWEKETRPYEALCADVEHTIADEDRENELKAYDFTTAIFDHRSGKLGLTVWSMAVAGLFDDPTEGDLRWAKEQQIWVNLAHEKFSSFISEQEDIKETVPREGQPFAGYEVFLFDSAEDLIAVLNDYRIDNELAPLEPHELLDALEQEKAKQGRTS